MIDKRLYYKYEIQEWSRIPNRAIFYSVEDIPLVYARNNEMVSELKANKPYTVWYGNELFSLLPWIG
jgi:hypothetical protein